MIKPKKFDSIPESELAINDGEFDTDISKLDVDENSPEARFGSNPNKIESWP